MTFPNQADLNILPFQQTFPAQIPDRVKQQLRSVQVRLVSRLALLRVRHQHLQPATLLQQRIFVAKKSRMASMHMILI